MGDKIRVSSWKTVSVGDEIDSICSRCKEETIHRVVAMVEERVHLVICTRCSGQHRYRPSLAARGRKVPLPSERQAKVLKKIEAAPGQQPQEPLEDWHKFKSLSKGTAPLLYDSAVSYHENQVIDHPVFGLGFVRQVMGPAKMEVVFERQIKILVMNRTKQDQAQGLI